MQRPPSPYQVLNVSPDAEPEVIEAAYKALMKKYHPDRRDGAAARATDLNAAFNILRDPHRRARHDADEKARRSPVTVASFEGRRHGPVIVARPPHPSGSGHLSQSRLGWPSFLFVAAVAAGVAALAIREVPDWPAARAFGLGVRNAAYRVQDAADGGGAFPPRRCRSTAARSTKR